MATLIRLESRLVTLLITKVAAPGDLGGEEGHLAYGTPTLYMSPHLAVMRRVTARDRCWRGVRPYHQIIWGSSAAMGC